MKLIRGSDLLKIGESVMRLSQIPAIAYLRGAEAALQSDPPDAKVALQLLAQALAILDRKDAP